MTKTCLGAAMLGIVLLATPATAEAPSEPSAAAVAFVEKFADDHLSGMLSKIGGQSQAMHTLAEIGDGRRVAAVFDAEIDAAVERHHEEWTHNLALAWSPLLSEAAMASIAAEGVESPYAEKYLENRDEAAAAMAALSQDLFKEILAEVIRNTVRDMTPEAPAEAPAADTTQAPTQ